MSRNVKRYLSVFLAAVMCLSLMPGAAFAEEYAEDYAEQCEHVYTDEVILPTCETDGYTRHVCALCGDEYCDCEVPACHSPVTVDEVPATETEPGMTAGIVCSECGAVLEGCEEIPALGTDEELSETEAGPDDSEDVRLEEESVMSEDNLAVVSMTLDRTLLTQADCINIHVKFNQDIPNIDSKLVWVTFVNSEDPNNIQYFGASDHPDGVYDTFTGGTWLTNIKNGSYVLKAISMQDGGVPGYAHFEGDSLPAELRGLTITIVDAYKIGCDVSGCGKIEVQNIGRLGETVSFDVCPMNGCRLSKLSVKEKESGTEIAVTGNSFVMPDCEVTISAEFVLDASKISSSFKISGLAPVKAEYTYGNEIALKFKVTGKGSIDSVRLKFGLLGGNYNNQSTVECFKNSKTGYYEAKSSIWSSWSAGDWIVYDITVNSGDREICFHNPVTFDAGTDYSNDPDGRRDVFMDMSSGNFKITGAVPEVEDVTVTFSENAVSAPAAFKAYLDIELNTGNAADTFAEGVICLHDTRTDYPWYFPLSKTADGTRLQATVEIDQYCQDTTFEVDKIEFTNINGYELKLKNGHNFETDASFSVTNENKDDEPPELVSISLSSNTVKVPGEITVTVETADDYSGAYYGEIWFYNALSEEYLGVYDLEDIGNGVFRGTIPTAYYYGNGENYCVSGGTYVLDTVFLEDRAGNWIEYGEAYYGGEPAPMPDACKNISVFVDWRYSINYVLNGGVNDPSNPDGYNSVTEPVPLGSPTREGYTFGGWFKDSSLRTALDELKPGMKSNLTLYAKWIPNEDLYSIEFNANGGAVEGSEVTGSMAVMEGLKIGTTYTLPAVGFTRPGFRFAGWAESSDGEVIYANKAKIKDLSLHGEEVQLYAVWERNTYTITFSGNGGKVGKAASYTQAVTCWTGQQLEENAFVRTGYTFKEWNTRKDGKGLSYADKELVQNPVNNAPNKGKVTLYAIWTANTYTIKYDIGAGVSGTMSPQAVAYDKSVKLSGNAFKYPGYSFAGWSVDGSETVKYKDKASVKNLRSEDGAEIKLTAVWKANTYTVSFSANGGKGTVPASVTKTGTDAVQIPEYNVNGLNFAGYTFKEWNTKADGTGTGYRPGESVVFDTKNKATVTLYAIWYYRVTFNPGTGTGVAYADSRMVYNRVHTENGEAFRKAGYYVAGWNKSEAAAAKGTVQYKVNAVKNVGPDTELFAVWKPLAYTIRFDANGGTGKMGNLSMTFNTAKALTANAFKNPGQTFLGWSLDLGAAQADFANKARIKDEIVPQTNKQVITLYAVWA